MFEKIKYSSVFFIISALFVYYAGIKELQNQELRKQWPLYKGTIIKSWIESGSHLEGSGNYELFIEF